MFDLLQHGVGGVEYAHTLARVGVGIMFAISGYDKLRDPTNVLATFKADGIPFIRFNRWFVPSVELMGGLGLIVGALTPLAALGLLAICIVATFTDGIKRFSDTTWADWLDDFLYLPEVLYCALLGYLVANGAGPFSLDALAAKLIG